MTKPFGRWLGNMIRGGLIGIAEAIPGISGGTIALVTGLYDNLIDAAGYLISAIKSLVIGRRAEAKENLRKVNWGVVVPALIGMAVFLLIAARLLAPLLEDYPQQTNALFFGMILVSVAIPIRMMRQRLRPIDFGLIVLGLVVAVILTGLPQGHVSDPPLWLVALAAAIAINALVLPGLSGSFMLLTMGMYTTTIGALNDRDLLYIGVFALGALIGLSTFVKGLQWLLHHKHQATLALMTGLMIGSLRVLWPWQNEETRALHAPSGDNIGSLALLAAVGAALVLAMIIVEVRTTRRNAIREATTETDPQTEPDTRVGV